MGLQENKQRVFLTYFTAILITEQFGQNKKRPKKLICFEFSVEIKKISLSTYLSL